jgi:hypothetical protein
MLVALDLACVLNDAGHHESLNAGFGIVFDQRRQIGENPK